MRINLKKRFTALMLAGMMVTSNVLPAYSATDGITVEQADASYDGQAGESGTALSTAAENDIAQEDAIADDADSTTDASVNAASDSASSTAASADAGDESHVGGQ